MNTRSEMKPMLDSYNFTPIGEFSTRLKHNDNYPIYLVESEQQENILNPFKRKSSISHLL